MKNKPNIQLSWVCVAKPDLVFVVHVWDQVELCTMKGIWAWESGCTLQIQKKKKKTQIESRKFPGDTLQKSIDDTTILSIVVRG